MSNKQGRELYHYTMCGLDNIYLMNGFEIRDTAYGETVSIVDVDGLHSVIAKNIIHNGAKPSGKEIRFLRKELEFSQAHLASLMDVDVQTVARWEKGHTEIPGPAHVLLRLIVEDHLSKDKLLSDAIEALTALDDNAQQTLTFESTGDLWKAAA